MISSKGSVTCRGHRIQTGIKGSWADMLASVILIGWCLTGNAFASELQPAQNLVKDGQMALQANQPIAILLVYSGLNSTRDLKEEALLPHLQSGLFDRKVLFREIAVNEEGTVIDFYGEAMPKSEYQTLFNITSLPAMVFVDGEGNRLTSPLFAGAYEYYGHYLKRKLNESMKALGNPTRFE